MTFASHPSSVSLFLISADFPPLFKKLTGTMATILPLSMRKTSVLESMKSSIGTDLPSFSVTEYLRGKVVITFGYAIWIMSLSS